MTTRLCPCDRRFPALQLGVNGIPLLPNSTFAVSPQFSLASSALAAPSQHPPNVDFRLEVFVGSMPLQVECASASSLLKPNGDRPERNQKHKSHAPKARNKNNRACNACHHIQHCSRMVHARHLRLLAFARCPAFLQQSTMRRFAHVIIRLPELAR